MAMLNPYWPWLRTAGAEIFPYGRGPTPAPNYWLEGQQFGGAMPFNPETIVAQMRQQQFAPNLPGVPPQLRPEPAPAFQAAFPQPIGPTPQPMPQMPPGGGPEPSQQADRFNPLNMALLAAGLGILGQSGRSLQPTSGSEAIGKGGMQGLQTYIGLRQQEKEDEIRAQELGLRRDEISGLKKWREAQLLEEQAKSAERDRISGLLQRYQTALRSGDSAGAMQIAREMFPKESLEAELKQPGNIQFEEFATGNTVNGKPEFQKFRIMPDGSKKKEGEPYVKSAAAEIILPGEKTQSAYAQKFGPLMAEKDTALMEEAGAAETGIDKIDALISHLETSDAITGLGADVFNNIARAAALLSRSEAAGKTVSDTELLDAMMGSDVFPMIKGLGIGARGLDTPEERKFLRRVMSGEITMNKETLIRLAEIRRNLAVRAVEKWNERKKSIPKDVLESVGISREPSKIPPLRQRRVAPAKKDPWER